MEKDKEQKPEQQEHEELQNISFANYIIFCIGEEEYGIPIEQVKEVTLTPTIYKMPRTPSFVKGVANIRGDIIAIIDLEERFGFKTKVNPLDQKKTGYILVIENEDYTMGFNVHKVPETLSITESMISKKPDFFEYSQINKNFIEGIGRVNGRLIILLNIDNILNFNEVQQLTSMVETEKQK